ncbi:RDD family protein [Nocardioides cynanchi]|uniref:RDD family protein n=1 Tax=Nocardioides cynanchi TaxID=2558918 RepID=UPI001243DCB4|nr:RDD family protein [Nocardioides cynanchi]
MSQYGNPPDPEQPGQSGQQPPANPYGAPPPPNPYGEPNPYGSAQQDPYTAPGGSPYGGAPANPYGAPANPYGASGPYGQQAPGFAVSGYASWISRVAASIIDGLLAAVAGIPAWIGYGILIANSTTTTDANGVTTTHTSGGAGAAILILVGIVTYAAFWIWNVCIKQGRTGATIGKGVLSIRLINGEGRPIGAGMSFLRQLAHILDGICYIGYLWPLWDAKKQTFADKIMSTVVVNASNPVPPV